MDIDINEIKKFIEANKENADVIEFTKNFVNEDNVKSYLSENENGKKLSQSLFDSKVTQGIKTWRENNEKKLIDAEVSKKVQELYPAETEEQKRLRDIEKANKELMAKFTKSEVKNTALKFATSEKIPIDIVDFFLGDDEHSTINNLMLFKEKWEKNLSESIKQELDSKGREPNKGSTAQSASYKDKYEEAVKRKDHASALYYLNLIKREE
jgi:hypothetical protein